MTAPRPEQTSAFRQAAKSYVEDIVQLASDLARIPTPTGDEAARARFVADWLRANAPPAVDNVEIDDLHNVLAVVNGRTTGSPVVLAAHLDTVFPRETSLDVRRDGDKVHGAGIGDNSLGTASLLFLPKLLETLGVLPEVPLILAAPVGEEGLGNLRGMRQVMNRCRDAGAAVAIEGHNLGRITATAVGSRRFRVTVTGPGGHSWGDYGRPSAVHLLGHIVADLADVPIPSEPKTTFNIGVIEGGISINTIAPVASMLVDLRSVAASTLRELAATMESRIDELATAEMTIEIDVLGERPAGSLPPDAPIVQIAEQALRSLGISPSLDASSTDANIPISMGIPAICIGLTTGGNVHRADEYVNINPLADGFAQLALIAVNLADHVAVSS